MHNFAVHLDVKVEIIIIGIKLMKISWIWWDWIS